MRTSFENWRGRSELHPCTHGEDEFRFSSLRFSERKYGNTFFRIVLSISRPSSKQYKGSDDPSSTTSAVAIAANALECAASQELVASLGHPDSPFRRRRDSRDRRDPCFTSQSPSSCRSDAIADIAPSHRRYVWRQECVRYRRNPSRAAQC